jgi:NTP pyrophosphatase (non-canonical NTP hydrolase)
VRRKLMDRYNRYRRNIKQVEDAGKCPRKHFAYKTIEECSELKVEAHILLKDVNYVSNKENLYGEIADVLNCIKYLKILFDLDEDKIARIMREKVDRGYKRGVD